MLRACIAVVDGTRARIYAYDHIGGVPLLGEPVDLVGGICAEFAVRVIDEIVRIAADQRFDHVVLVGSASVIEGLRVHCERLREAGFTVDEVIPPVGVRATAVGEVGEYARGAQ